MASARKILDKVLRGSSDANVAFRDLRQLLISLGFTERISGGHHTFRRAGVRELINIQKEGNKAKVTVRFKGRELVHSQLGKAMLNRIIEERGG